MFLRSVCKKHMQCFIVNTVKLLLKGFIVFNKIFIIWCMYNKDRCIYFLVVDNNRIDNNKMDIINSINIKNSCLCNSYM